MEDKSYNIKKVKGLQKSNSGSDITFNAKNFNTNQSVAIAAES